VRCSAQIAVVGIPILLFVNAHSRTAGHKESAPGVPNFHRVNENLYRGAHPTAEGLHSLVKLGVKTVIDLRGFDSNSWEQRRVTAIGMQYLHFPLSTRRVPPPDEIQSALGALMDESLGPIFIHCQGGDDRTGMIIACYRILHDHWTNSEALNEARQTAGRRLTQAMEQCIRNFHPAGGPASPVVSTVR
jgi:protein tyrosine/serine phosphatase